MPGSFWTLDGQRSLEGDIDALVRWLAYALTKEETLLEAQTSWLPLERF